MSNIKKSQKFDFSKINKEKASQSIKSFNAGLASVSFQNKLLQYQISLDKNEGKLEKLVASLENRFSKVAERESIVKASGKVPVAVYDELLEGFNAIANGEALIVLVQSKVEQMEKDVSKCSNEDQINLVKKYYATRFLTPLKKAKIVEKFLNNRGFKTSTKGIEEAEVISSKLLPSEAMQEVETANV